MWAFLVDQLGRRMLLRVYPFASVGAPPGNLVSWILIALNVLALVAYYFKHVLIRTSVVPFRETARRAPVARVVHLVGDPPAPRRHWRAAESLLAADATRLRGPGTADVWPT